MRETIQTKCIISRMKISENAVFSSTHPPVYIHSSHMTTAVSKISFCPRFLFFAQVFPNQKLTQFKGRSTKFDPLARLFSLSKRRWTTCLYADDSASKYARTYTRTHTQPNSLSSNIILRNVSRTIFTSFLLQGLPRSCLEENLDFFWRGGVCASCHGCPSHS